MNTYDINTWVDTILALNDQDISSEKPLPSALKIEAEDSLEVYYAPFDYIHRDARLVIVGITPGRTQAIDAILTARRALLEGQSPEESS